MSEDGSMTLTEHLRELRGRIIYSGSAVAVGMVLCFAFAKDILTLFLRPLLPLLEVEAEGGRGIEMIFTGPLEPFKVYLKIATIGGLVVALPYIVYQICMFVFPGLTPKERRAATILIVGSTLLAFAGTGMAYFGVFPFVLPYLMEYAPEWVEAKLDLKETLDTMWMGLLGFALAFQFPMVVLVLVYLDLLDPRTLQNNRRIAIVGIAFASAFFTPPDPITMVMMGLPLWVLFELSIVLGHLMVRARQKAA